VTTMPSPFGPRSRGCNVRNAGFLKGVRAFMKNRTGIQVLLLSGLKDE
jgi:hypothetical protein